VIAFKPVLLIAVAVKACRNPEVEVVVILDGVVVDPWTSKLVEIVGDVANTTDPDPVAVVDPVPPFNTGRAVPDNVTAKVPDEVMGDPEIERKDGTVIATDVTVAGVAHVMAVAPPP
jgi:hypothetical protein